MRDQTETGHFFKMKPYSSLIRVLLLVMISLLPVPAQSQEDDRSAIMSSAFPRSKGGSMYVPVYAYIYFGDQFRRFNLTVTVSLRNPNENVPLTIERADYFDSEGKLLRSFVPKNGLELKPLGAQNFKIQESDESGGSGASVLLRWRSTAPAAPPIAESVMIGTAQGQGISFLSRGVVTSLEERSN
jgi:hypothetical protein